MTGLHAPSALWVTLHHIAQAPRYNRWIASLIQPYVGRCVLDVGCGVGTFVPVYLHSDQAVALDVSPAMVQEARQRWGRYSHIRFLVGDITQPETLEVLQGLPFDTVLAVNVLEHIADEQRALKHMFSLLRLQGHAVVYVPARPELFGRLDVSLGHRRRYTRRVLVQRLQEVGFTIRVCRPVNTLGILGWWWDNWLRRYEAIPLWQVKLFDALVPLWRPMEERLRRVWPTMPGLSLLCVARKPADKETPERNPFRRARL